jgi:hypothetical protein
VPRYCTAPQETTVTVVEEVLVEPLGEAGFVFELLPHAAAARIEATNTT